MEPIAPDFHEKVAKGDFIVGGSNFGCGSSREHAPIAILALGIPLVIARSFARIFYRNSFNKGLALLEADIVDRVKDGDQLEIDLLAGEIAGPGIDVVAKPIPPFMIELINEGGLMNYLKRRLEARA
jgi:3-isopropylmalate/(R)-2-methylmalate dehydratase small subunit